MKTILRIILGVFASSTLAIGQSAVVSSTSPSSLQPDTPYSIVAADANSRVWQRTVYEHGPDGQARPRVRRYTELASGLNYKDSNGQWQESKELIEVFSGGAIARYGQNKVIFANNLNTSGAIDLHASDGGRIQSSILGLAYVDTATSNSVQIAQLQNSEGELVSSNQVLYQNAFDGIKASVRYTYTRAGLEQDVILGERPPSPQVYGLNPQTTELEVVTEIINSPTPVVGQVYSPASGSEGDENIKWGVLSLGQSKAFGLNDQGNMVPVNKQLVTVQGRTFLFEKVKFETIQQYLTTLPLQAHSTSKLPPLAGKFPLLLKRPLAQTAGKPMKLAAHVAPRNGYVLDYVMLGSDLANYTFQSDMTYYMSGSSYFEIDNSATFEGGTVIKFATNSASFHINYASLSFKSSSYRPIILTAVDDNTVGETIPGSTGTPSGYYGNGITIYNNGNVTLHDIRMSYLNLGFVMFANWAEFDNIQAINCNTPIVHDWCGVTVNNGLFYNIAGTAVKCSGSATPVYGTQLTIDNCQTFADSMTSSLNLINSLVTATPNLLAGSGTLSTASTTILSSNTGVYQTTAGGSHYLASGSAYRGVGTANISSTLLASLRQKTTYPPVVYTSPTIYFTNNLNLYPQAQRDTNAAPDLGYHYDPLDYMFGTIYLTNATITLNAGTAIGVFATNTVNENYGIAVSANAQFISQGSPNALNHIVEYNTVQEQTPAGSVAPAYAMVTHYSGGQPFQISSRFTDWSAIAQDVAHFNLNGDPSGAYVYSIRDSQFHGGLMEAYNSTLNLTNCLLERAYTDFEPSGTNPTVIRNNTIWNGTFGFYPTMDNSTIQDNLFDGASIPDDIGSSGVNYTGGHNAYVTTNNIFNPTEYGDVILTNSPVYQSSALGNYYLPTNSPLVNAGSAKADSVGLYHYTTQTNQSIEASSIVDIGYHYMAVDANDNPLQTLTNGVPDYLVDANGDGLPDWWEEYYFGTISGITAASLDTGGYSYLYDYQNSTDPNIILFTVQATNNYVNTNTVGFQINVKGGQPSYFAVLMDNTNFTNASWSAYNSSNVTVSLGTTQGWHEAWVGLKGMATTATPSWAWRRVMLDPTPPQLIITNPIPGTVDKPMIQIYGYSPEPLAALSYDVTNSLGLITNQNAGVTGQYYDEITSAFTTNYFEGLDVPLTNGLNTVTFHATDLAGNVTTTNFTFTVSYISKTNPVVQLSWPQNGTLISGNLVSLRGMVDDPTVTVSASIVDTNGYTNTVAGIVERNGRFWVEGLPVNNGTNQVSLTFQNVINQTTTTNFLFIQSPVSLSIDPLTNSSQLWQPTVNLSGTVSDPSYIIWVNGVQGTNFGDGTWSTYNVPTTPGGVSIFDVTAYPPAEAPTSGSGGNGVNPPGIGSVNEENEGDKPLRYYMSKYIESDSGGSSATFNATVPPPCTWTFTWSDSHACSWADGVAGWGHTAWDLHENNQDCQGGFLHTTYAESDSYSATSWPDPVYGTANSIYTDIYSITTPNGVESGNTSTPDTEQTQAPINEEHCNIKLKVGWPSSWPLIWTGSSFPEAPENQGDYTRIADATMVLQTGGKAIAHRQNLFEITASAGTVQDQYGYTTIDEYHNVYWYGSANPATVPVQPQNIRIDGMPLGSDGNQWRLYFDGDVRDITPKVAGNNFYEFNVVATKYILTIQANGYTLLQGVEPNTTFCVGQQITFAPNWNVVPPYVNSVQQWVLPGNYVNEQYQYSPDCTSYRLNTTLLENMTTSCWYVNQPGGNASFEIALTFANGQTVFIVRRGVFAIYQPTVLIDQYEVNGFPYNEWLTSPPWQEDWTLNYVGNIGLGKQGGPNNMSFRAQVTSTEFAGSAEIIQLLTLSASALPVDWNFSTPWLDNEPFYPNTYTRVNISPNPPPRLNECWLDDSPQNGGYGSFFWNSSYSDYIMFAPDGAGSIFVPIGKITWAVSFGATYPSITITPNTVSGPTGPVSCNTFPVWPVVFKNSNN